MNRTFQIDSYPNPITVKGPTTEHFGIFKSGDWTIIHLATGRKVSRQMTRATALALAEHLESTISPTDLTQPDPYAIDTESMLAALNSFPRGGQG